MTRLLLKFGVPVMAFLVVFALLMPMLGEHLPAHMLAFDVIDYFDGSHAIHVVHLESGLIINATPISATASEFRITADGRWLIYHPAIGSNRRFALVNLHTWETTLLPELQSEYSFVSTVWQADSRRVWMGAYDRYGTDVTYYSYDLQSSQLTQVDGIASFFPSVWRNQVTVGFPIAQNEVGEPTLGVTLDDNHIPRLYDYASDEPMISFAVGRDIQPVSVSPDDAYLAAVLSRNRQSDLYLVPAWEGEPINLTNNADVESLPIWSPDNTYIAYTSQQDARRIATNEVRVYDVGAGEVAYVLHFDTRTIIANNAPAWLP